MTLDVDQLRTFCDVCITKNFTQTASNMGITESTVSYRIKELEKYLERKLFYRRSNKTVVCTEFGDKFFSDAQEILTIVGKYKGIVGDGGLNGTIKVSAGEIGGVYLMPPIMRAFESKFNGIKIKIEINNSLTTLKKLNESECDIGITASVDFYPNSYLRNVEVIRLLKLTYGVIAPLGHPIGKKKSVTVNELLGLPYISRDENSGSQREIIKILAEKGLSENDLHIVWRFDNSYSVINAVSEGLGLSIVNKAQASKYVNGGLLEFIPLDTNVESTLNLLDHWKGTNQAVNTLVRFIKYYVATSVSIF